MRLDRKLLLDYYVGGFVHVVLKPCVVVVGKILRRNHELKSCSSVTLLKLMGGGSLVVAYPALLALKRAPGVRELRLVTLRISSHRTQGFICCRLLDTTSRP